MIQKPSGPTVTFIAGRTLRPEAAWPLRRLRDLLLHRVQRGTVREVFHGDDLGAVGLAGEQNAGVDRLVTSRPLTVFLRTTVQAPQSPSAQPSLVPTACSVRRR